MGTKLVFNTDARVLLLCVDVAVGQGLHRVFMKSVLCTYAMYMPSDLRPNESRVHGLHIHVHNILYAICVIESGLRFLVLT